MNRVGMRAALVAAWILVFSESVLISPPASAEEPAEADRIAGFRTLMTGARLVGSFTTDGDTSTRRPERYVVSSAVKLAGDLWLLTTRITYGDVDLTLPVPVAIKWAGDTPVITLDSVALPGLGTFSSRVVLDRDRYAGTWQHDAVGGHLFGRIERSEAGPTDPPATDRPLPGAGRRQEAAAPQQDSARPSRGGDAP